jgi:hypothetical protein
MIQPDLALGLLEVTLNRPTRPGDSYQLDQGCPGCP